MTSHLIWAFVATVWALVLWDMVRRWAFATATRALKADLDALRAELGDGKLVARVKQLETMVIALKAHAETQRAARANPFARKAAG